MALRPVLTGTAPCPSRGDPEDRTLIVQLPDELKKTLLAHLTKTGDQEKLELARNAFQMPRN